jgi:signal transduction histidine kinase
MAADPACREGGVSIGRRTGTVALAVVLLAAPVAVSSAQPVSAPTDRNVLALYWYARDNPTNVLYERGLLGVLRSGPRGSPEYYSEYLEVDRFPGEEQARFLRDYLHRKYADRKMDVIIATAETPFRFLLANRTLFPDVPIVYTAFGPAAAADERTTPGVVGIFIVGAYRKTVELVRRLHPETERLLVITSPSNSGGTAHDRIIRRELAPFEGTLTIDYLANQTTNGVLEKISNAPPRSVVLYVRHAGPTNHAQDLVETISLFARASSAPLYSIASSHFGHGIVGGYLVDHEGIGAQAGRLVQKILAGADPQTLPATTATLVPTLDWRQLQRWNVDPSRLPAETNVRFRVRTAWEQYRWHIVGAAALFGLQSILVAALLTQRLRRRRAERIARAGAAALRNSYQRIRMIAGRLITAQEETRTRIARDLHDDVCQELAGFSIAVGDLRRRQGDLQDPGTQMRLFALQRRMQELVDDVRRLSHDLHPSAMRHLGLAAALEAHCIEIEQRYDVQVTFLADGNLRLIPEETALCLFRISQEALRNAATHGEARRVTLSIRSSETGCEMTITDDGRGFDLEAVRHRGDGLGLVSMEERASLVGGEMRILTSPGTGTIIHVQIPAGAGLEADAIEQEVEPVELIPSATDPGEGWR